MAFAKFEGNRFRIGGEIAENHAILVNLTSSIVYTSRQINLYRIFFTDFSVNSQLILMKFCKDYFRVRRRLP